MFLYIANTTVQVVDFVYRLSHEDRTGGGRIYGKAIRQIIQPGQQIRLTNDLSKIQIDDIVGHYTTYGMIEYRDIDMTRGFAGLCFQVDQRMEADRLTELMLRNQRISVDKARQMREEAAIAAHAAIEAKQIAERPDAELIHVDMEIEEVRSKNIPYEVGIARFRETSRGHIMGLQSGMMKMIFALSDKRLLGVHIVGEGATELIHIGQAVLNLGGTVDYFVQNTFNFPTLAEAYKIAALDAWNRMPPAGVICEKAPEVPIEGDWSSVVELRKAG